ncbi:LacI family DNA-binding transcriptional regulator [soil metagenome]
MPRERRGEVPQRITSHDVAARAGVSQSTVSLVLSGSPRARIADATRTRVIEAARDLGYRPNLLARGLVQRRSFALGIVVSDLDNPLFTEVVSGAERVAADAGYGVLLGDAREIPAGEHVQRLRERQVDGVILAGVALDALPEGALSGANVVVVDEPSATHPGVASDAFGAGRLAARHLLELGHRRLAFIGPASESHTFRMRERGFVAELREAGIPLPSARLRRARPSVAGGEGAMRALLREDEGTTAVFCANDLTALGALKAGAAAGMTVPEGLSVVGCDDIEMARYVTPELTTVRVPARGLGARAARLLLLTLDGRDTGALTGKPLEVQLVLRGTTAAPSPAGSCP